MIKFILSMVIMAHALVHSLYLGHSQRRFELQPKLTWPDGSWAFSKLVGDEATRLLASIFCGVAAAGFVAADIGILFGQAWWRWALVAAALLSAVGYVLFWDGKMRKLPAQGAIGILIDIVLLVVALTIKWPEFVF